MSYTHNATDGTVVVKDANATMIDKVVNALTMPFAGDDILHTSDEVMYNSVVWGSAGLVGGGIIGRRRALRGDAPIARFFF